MFFVVMQLGLKCSGACAIVVAKVQQKRWKVETNSRLDSVLNLSSINLPGGVLVGALFSSIMWPSKLLPKQNIIYSNYVLDASAVYS